MLTCILKTVDTHADLLRESAADVGNDHRLGANEAPPAILSVYLGEQLEDVLSQLISTGAATHSISGQRLETGVKSLPDFMKDATDRNRTSPFAFTGNKFEFHVWWVPGLCFPAERCVKYNYYLQGICRGEM